MLVWKPPGLFIVGANMALFLVGGGFFGVHALEILPAEDSTMMALMRLTGVGIILSDIWFRRDQDLPFFSLEASTFFFVIPTWAIGVFFLLASKQFLVG